MPGEQNLDELRTGMAPIVHPETFVYCCFANFHVPSGVEPVCTFVEVEGLTAIVPKSQADLGGLAYEFESRMITLSVHSSLDAVGFLALVCGELAAQNVPCNVVSGYHHDHLFVPEHRSAETMTILATLGSSDRAAALRLT